MVKLITTNPKKAKYIYNKVNNLWIDKKEKYYIQLYKRYPPHMPVMDCFNGVQKIKLYFELIQKILFVPSQKYDY